jgi:hypothetical protein
VRGPRGETITSGDFVSECPYAFFYVNGERVLALIDSGSETGIMSHRVARFTGSPMMDNPGINLNGLGGKCAVLGAARRIPVETGVVSVEENFLIHDDDNISVILGSLWMKRVKLAWEFTDTGVSCTITSPDTGETTNFEAHYMTTGEARARADYAMSRTHPKA